MLSASTGFEKLRVVHAELRVGGDSPPARLSIPQQSCTARRCGHTEMVLTEAFRV
jgi:hypothetical protein